jgi:hypothetical protein
MIIVNLKGGLGNQMFQYAFGRALSLKNEDILKLDTQSLSKAKEIGNIYRPFDLEAFNIYKDIAAPAEVSRIQYSHGLLSKLAKIFKQKVLRQSNVVFNKSFLSLSGNQYLDGYWQSPLYFQSIRETLLVDFTLRDTPSTSGQALQEHIKATNSVSIHVRRGDYVLNPRVLRENGICSVAYYKQAIDEIETIQADITYFVFSDDIDWVKNNLDLPGDNVKYVEDATLTVPQELYLMSQCKHNIIANSSFSWWAAWLNQNPQKTVIAPAPWFDTIEYDKHLIPESWTLLPKN